MANENGANVARGEWTVRSLTDARGAFNGVRWWAQRLAKRLASLGCGGTVAFPEGVGGEAAERRLEALRAAAARVAAGGEFGKAECHVWGKLGFDAAYRGVGGRSPAVEVDGVRQERMVAFAKALCEEAGEEWAVVWEGVDCLQSVEGGKWEGDAGEVWWLEKKKGVDEMTPNPVAGNRESVEKESSRCEAWVRRSGRVVVVRAKVEDWFAPEGVFRFAWISLRKRRGCGAMEMALRWARKDGEGGMIAERVLVASGATMEEVTEAVAGVPGATCREVHVGEEVKGDGRWLEEVFGERPEGEEDGEWRLAEAGYVEPPCPSVFGRHDRYWPVRAEEEASPAEGAENAEGERCQEGHEGAEAPDGGVSKIRAVTLLQWMGPRSWTNKAEERRVPDRVEEVLRSGHHAWFRVATGEGVPSSRCWMVFNAPGEWAYWRQFGVTRVLDICPDGCRGYWSGDGKHWWKVEACPPRGKRVRVDNAKAAYQAACGEMPWEVPFFDRSDKNRVRLERMYAYVVSVLERRGMDTTTLNRRLERAATAVGFSQWATRGMLYGGRFEWRKGEMW